MIEITKLDGVRRGVIKLQDGIEELPALLHKDIDKFSIGALSFERPLSYPFRHLLHEENSITPLLRVSEGTPKRVASRIQRHNSTLEKKGKITPVFLCGIDEYDDLLVNSLPSSDIFMFDLCNERTLLKYYFKLRDRYPAALFYCECGPLELPILAYAGFDLFPENEENLCALNAIIENPTPQYVEMQACASLGAKRLLDILYHELWEEHEKYIHNPTEKEPYISRDSFFRPITRRWEKNVVKRYAPQSNIILLLPCSVRKPYSISQSHRKYITVVRRALREKYDSLCQLIVTSPYGIVPRELETLIDYDIVVTGQWYAEEHQRSTDMLASLIKSIENPIIIAHLPKEELDIVATLDAKVIPTVEGHPTSKESLKNLFDTLLPYRDILESPDHKLGYIRKLSEFLYGIDILPKEKLSIKGKMMKQIFLNNTCIATWQSTLRPIKVNQKALRKWINIEFDIKGDLFCVGVADADDGIRPGDDVIIYREDKAVAIGTAIVNGTMMKQMKKGKAAKIRKRM